MEYIKTLDQSIAFLGDYPPRQCGIATFTYDLVTAIKNEYGNKKIQVLSMTNIPEGYKYNKDVTFEIRDNKLADFEQAADYINTNNIELLCIQHEFGIYGSSWGSNILLLLDKIKLPIVTTFHTILDKDIGQLATFSKLYQRSNRAVVMSYKAIDFIKKDFDAKKVRYIPHGIPDFPFIEPSDYKVQLKVQGKKVILTFGLLSPNKGVEYMIDAMPKIVEKHADCIYIILGATHPEIIRQQGEAYRFNLQLKVKKLGIEDNVIFMNRYVSLEQLFKYICVSDIYVTPYLDEKQITSGTLAYALGAGKLIISTPYWYAQELLADNKGKLVPFKDSNALAEAINNCLDNPDQMAKIKENSYQFGRKMIWKEVARQYIRLFEEVLDEWKKEPKIVTLPQTKKQKIPIETIPEPKLNHLLTMTDDFGLIQHAMFTVPRYKDGYCLDDNARALIVSTQYYNLYKDNVALELLKKYLAFTIYCQKEDGYFSNFISMDKLPLKDQKFSDDCHGRAIWGLGYVVANAPDYFWMVAKDAFDKSLSYYNKLNLRGTAFAIHGLYQYLKKYHGVIKIKEYIKTLANKLVVYYNENSTRDWQWFEDILTYSNGVIPDALWLAAEIFPDEKEYINIAAKTTDFLISKTLKDGQISLIGNKNWYKIKDKAKSDFDQQPIDAMWLVEVGKSAFSNTRENRYLHFSMQAFNWYFGNNDLQIPVYDFYTGGCYDALTPSGVNLNQGAESSLSFLLSLFSIIEMKSFTKV